MNRKLRIAILASNTLRIPPYPPEKYIPNGWAGAVETVVHSITEKLVEMGHDVTLFAAGDSDTKAKLVSISDKSSYENGHLADNKEYEYMLISKAYEMAKNGDFDIIHSHFDRSTLYFAPLVDTPTVTTLHSRIGIKPDKDLLYFFKDTQWYISISDAQREDNPKLQFAATVYNGIPIDEIPFSDTKENYVMCASRVMSEKGTDIAIRVAKEANIPLYIFGPVDKESEFWKKDIEPFIDNENVFYMGMVPRKELYIYMSKARAFLAPIRWREPFGLTVAEAMATGTPAIAFPHGSMRELIDDGETGYIVQDEKEMVQRISDSSSINSQLCRDRVSQRFSIDAMAAGYEKAYYHIIEQTNKSKI